MNLNRAWLSLLAVGVEQIRHQAEGNQRKCGGLLYIPAEFVFDMNRAMREEEESQEISIRSKCRVWGNVSGKGSAELNERNFFQHYKNFVASIHALNVSCNFLFKSCWKIASKLAQSTTFCLFFSRPSSLSHSSTVCVVDRKTIGRKEEFIGGFDRILQIKIRWFWVFFCTLILWLSGCEQPTLKSWNFLHFPLSALTFFRSFSCGFLRRWSWNFQNKTWKCFSIA